MTLLSVLKKRESISLTGMRNSQLLKLTQHTSDCQTVSSTRRIDTNCSPSLFFPLDTISDKHSVSENLSFCFRKKKSVTRPLR